MCELDNSGLCLFRKDSDCCGMLVQSNHQSDRKRLTYVSIRTPLFHQARKTRINYRFCGCTIKSSPAEDLQEKFMWPRVNFGYFFRSRDYRAKRTLLKCLHTYRYRYVRLYKHIISNDAIKSDYHLTPDPTSVSAVALQACIMQKHTSAQHSTHIYCFR